MLEYPKEVMKTSELVEMGFPEQMLLNAYRVKGQTFAQKSDPTKIENRSIPRGAY